jgi:hypothetical protein
VPRTPARIASAALPLAALLAGCSHFEPPSIAGAPGELGPRCATADVRIDFDFPAAAPSRCVIEGPRSFALVLAPEHAPPINPSPWYAFRYTAAPGDPVRVRLDYLGAAHRYPPKLLREGTLSELPAAVAKDGRSAAFVLPAGSGTVSAQPIVSAADHARFAARLAGAFGAARVQLGRSLDGRPIEAIRLGNPSASHLVVILGRQHPPEVTGTWALEPFVSELAQMLASDPDLAGDVQVLAVPLLNPDGVERGHWRANRGGVDLNRDWGPFTQPETRAVRDWLVRELPRTRPAAMIDFHSTARSLFYVQGDEASAADRRFTDRFLGGKERRFAGYPFTIEPRNANPGSGTAKNWFFACFGVPSLTYEVGDAVERGKAANAAQALAHDFMAALRDLPEAKPDLTVSGACPMGVGPA